MGTKIIHTMKIVEAFRQYYGKDYSIDMLEKEFYFKVVADLCGYALKFESEDAKLIFQMKFLVS